MSRISDFFVLAVVSTTGWVKVVDADGFGLEDLFDRGEHLALCNKTAGRIVQYSFSGDRLDGGELDASDPTGAVAFDDRRAPKGLWLRLKTAGTAATVAVYGWSR